MFSDLIKKIHRLISRLTGRTYFREGKCNQCGACCHRINLRTRGVSIRSEEEFEQLKEVFPEYERFYLCDTLNNGTLLFSCRFLSEEMKCTDYRNRPLICKTYPSEEVLFCGGELYPTCGFRFTLLRDFRKVLENEMKEKNSEQDMAL